MSNIDKQALREAAEKATESDWIVDAHEGWHAVIPVADAVNGNYIIAEFQGPESKRNRDFVAAANPTTVLALLDELEVTEKRIAELEAQEVREEGNQFLVVRHPGRSPVIKHSAGDLEGFLRQLLEHDPMATIDIITHRYYGVGGQWVQDADEYLQMMAAAAGKGE